MGQARDVDGPETGQGRDGDGPEMGIMTFIFENVFSSRPSYRTMSGKKNMHSEQVFTSMTNIKIYLKNVSTTYPVSYLIILKKVRRKHDFFKNFTKTY